MLIAALLAGSAAAGAPTDVSSSLALMPLPQSVLGSQVSGLALDRDSGTVTNSEAADDANRSTTGAKLAALGRITGYQLDFGGDTPAGGGLYQVETIVEAYRSPAAAARGLAFWRSDDMDQGSVKSLGGSLSLSRFQISGLGDGNFADVGTASLPGAPPFSGADAGFRNGPIVGLVSVGGGDLGRLRSLATEDAKALTTRITDVLAGRTTGPLTALPTTKAGPPPNGPDLSALALKPTDFVAARLTKEGYQLDSDLDPISEYERSMAPAGNMASFQEQVALFKDSTQATVELAVLRAVLTTKAGLTASGLNTKGQPSYRPRTVPTHAGDQSFAVFGVDRAPNGTSVNLGYVVVRVGSTLELVIFGTPTANPLLDSAIQELATVTAGRAAQGLHRPGVA